MSEVAPAATPSGPPAGWYDDPSGSPRQRWYDGTAWTDHYQTGSGTAAPQEPVHVALAAPVQTNVRQARDKAQYVRQQQGHSFVKHWFVLGIFTFWILPIYYSVSPNHYWRT